MLYPYSAPQSLVLPNILSLNFSTFNQRFEWVYPVNLSIESHYKEHPEEQIDASDTIKNYTKMIAPILLPLLNLMANLDEDNI